MTETNRKRNIALALEKARSELQDAGTLLQAQSFAGSVGHAYYAAFQAARALLLSQEEEPRTHSGLQSRLSLHFVRSGRLTPELGNALAVLQAQRERATYDAAAVFTNEIASSSLAQAQEFVEAAEHWLQENGWR